MFKRKVTKVLIWMGVITVVVFGALIFIYWMEYNAALSRVNNMDWPEIVPPSY